MGISIFARHEASAHPDLVVLDLKARFPVFPNTCTACASGAMRS
jgi:hypothetical protein